MMIERLRNRISGVRRIFLIGIAPAVVLLTGGCGDEAGGPAAPDPTATDTLQVDVRHRDTGLPARGVKLVVMDSQNSPAAEPVRTDPQGRGRLVVTAAQGPLHVVAFTGDSLFVHELPTALAWPGAGPAGAEVTVGTRIQTGGLPRIAGHVVDHDTSEPLAAAFVSLLPYLYGYLGRTDPSDDVTLTDGAFRVSNIPFAIDPVSGNLRQIMPLLITRDGYLPVAYTHRLAHGDNDLDIAGVTIRLVRDIGGGSTLSGVISFGVEPVADLPVGLGSIGEPGDKTAVGLPGRVALTDQDGRFTFAGLPAGGYVLHAGYLPDDGWLMPSQPASRLYEVGVDAMVQADTLQVIRAIEPLEPLGRLTAVPDRFAWVGVAEADSYIVYLRGIEIARTEPPEARDLDLTDLPAGWHPWTVIAVTATGQLVGGSEAFARFRIPPPDEGR